MKEKLQNLFINTCIFVGGTILGFLLIVEIVRPIIAAAAYTKYLFS